MSSSKISVVLAATALVVSVLFATPLGQAASRMIVPKNSVGAAQLKQSAVTGVKVKDGTLLAADFKAGQLPRGSQGPRGAQGVPGPQGPKGNPGAPGATHVIQRVGSGPQAGGNGYSTATASCHAGETLVGGGGLPNSAYPADPTVIKDGPESATTWIVGFRNDSPNGYVTAVAYALCATP